MCRSNDPLIDIVSTLEAKHSDSVSDSLDERCAMKIKSGKGTAALRFRSSSRGNSISIPDERPPQSLNISNENIQA